MRKVSTRSFLGIMVIASVIGGVTAFVSFTQHFPAVILATPSLASNCTDLTANPVTLSVPGEIVYSCSSVAASAISATNGPVTATPTGFKGEGFTTYSLIAPGGSNSAGGTCTPTAGIALTDGTHVSVPTGNYNYCATFTSAPIGNGFAAFSVTWSNVVGAPDFAIAASRTSLGLALGGSDTSTITVTSLNGFTGTVKLAASVVPSSGLIVSLSVPTMTLGTSGTSTLTVTGSISGYYNVNVTGTSGSTTRWVLATVGVAIESDFSISSSTSAATVQAGGSITSTITLTSLNGFSGTVALSDGVSPLGPTSSFAATLITLSSGGTGTSTLTVSTIVATVPATYTVTVNGVSGSVRNSTSLVLTVTPP